MLTNSHSRISSLFICVACTSQPEGEFGCSASSPSGTQLSPTEPACRAQGTGLSLWSLSLSGKGRIVIDVHGTPCAIGKGIFRGLAMSGLRKVSVAVGLGEQRGAWGFPRAEGPSAGGGH